MKTPPEYGEPWYYDDDLDLALNRNGSAGDERRIVDCVNACQGMTDPAAEIQAMREAIKEARKALKAWPRAGSGMSTDFTAQSEAFRTGQCAIAKLQPFIK